MNTEEKNLNHFVDSITNKNSLSVFEQNVLVKKKVLDKFGMTLINKNRKKLCLICSGISGCNLFPITIAGEDCPYFNKARTLL